MLTVGLGRGASWTEEVSRAACAHQTAQTSPGKDRSAAQMGRPTKTNAHCSRRNARATPTWTCSTRGSARVSKYCLKSAHVWDSTFLKHACAQNPAVSSPFFVFRVIFSQNHLISLSRQKRAVTCYAPGAPHASWTRQITHIVSRVIGFAPRWRRLSSTCVETTGSSMRARVTWEELPVSSADLSEWLTRGNASVSLQPEPWECETFSLTAPPALPLNIVWVHFLPGQFCSYSLLIFANIPPRRGS